ncbi:MAG: hypothetical protein ACPGVP_03910 [Thiolinea sp.]
MEVNYHNYEYHIAIPPFTDDHPIHDTLIPYWRSFWKNLLSGINSKEGLNENELYWQDRITYITHRGEIVAIHFLASYKASEFKKAEFTQQYLSQDVDKALLEASSESDRINTLQYLSVDPAYSHRKTGIHFSSVLSDLSTLHHEELRATKTLSIVRNSVGVHNMARKFGYQIHNSINRHGEESTIMYCRNPKRHPKQSIREVSEYFWKNRKIVAKEEVAA